MDLVDIAGAGERRVGEGFLSTWWQLFDKKTKENKNKQQQQSVGNVRDLRTSLALGGVYVAESCKKKRKRKKTDFLRILASMI